MGSSVLLVILGLKVGLVPLARGAKILIPSIVSAEALTELRGPWINRGIMFWEFWHSRKSANGRRKKRKKKKKEGWWVVWEEEVAVWGFRRKVEGKERRVL